MLFSEAVIIVQGKLNRAGLIMSKNNIVLFLEKSFKLKYYNNIIACPSSRNVIDLKESNIGYQNI